MITCYMKGSCEPLNPGGTESYAFIVFQDGNKIYYEANLVWPHFLSLPNIVFKPVVTSINTSQYYACIFLLNYLLQNGFKDECIIIYSDSKLVTNQMNEHWKIGQGHYLFLAHYCKHVLMNLFKDIKFQLIPETQNFIANELSKEVLRNAGIEISNWKENSYYWVKRTKEIKKEKLAELE